MHAAIRAHRILTAMTNYEKANLVEPSLLELGDGRLGEAIGFYRNPGPEGEVVGIFADGLVWRDNDHWSELRFRDVAEVALADGKRSEALLLRVQDGRQLRLPVKGHHGQFYDSMGMLRFLDRVLQDLRR